MGCGCKNKTNGQQVQQPVQTQQQNNETVKNAVQHIVEKYYNKK
jgi:hypothetical protein